MTSITDHAVNIQTTSESTPSTPVWFGEVVLISRYLQMHGVLSKITEQVRFAQKRFGPYDVIDFFAVLFGYCRFPRPSEPLSTPSSPQVRSRGEDLFLHPADDKRAAKGGRMRPACVQERVVSCAISR